MATALNEPIEFLDIVLSKGFMNDNTVNSRRTACKKFFDILDEDQKNVEYVRENLDVIKARFTNLNKDVAGTTVDEYARRVKLVLDDFSAWKDDRGGWERTNAAKQSARPSGDGEKKARTAKSEKKSQGQANGDTLANGATEHTNNKPETRTVTFPIRPDFDLSVTLPRAGISVDELKRLVYFLLPYTQDWEPTQAPRTVFAMLERDDSRPH